MTATAATDPLALLKPGKCHEVYAALRASAPVYWSSLFGGWVITSYAEALTLLRDPDLLVDAPVQRVRRLAARGGPKLENFAAMLGGISFHINPPRHAAVRKFLSAAMQVLWQPKLRNDLSIRAAGQLALGRAAGGLDLARDFGNDIAGYALKQFFGIPDADALALTALSADLMRFLDHVPGSLHQLAAADLNVGQLLEQFRELARSRRHEPGDDGLSRMLTAGAEAGISDLEVAAFCAFFFFAGEETTATAIAGAAVMLLEDTTLRARLTAEPQHLQAAAKEFLRLVCPGQYAIRTAARDFVLGGQPIKAGQGLNIVLAAANRDPAVFARPDAVVLDRAGPDSLTFGAGAYRCLGGGLATAELEIALAALLDNPDLQLDTANVAWSNRLRVAALAKAPARFATAG